MIGYVTVGSNDLEKARDFYDALMPVIGAGGSWSSATISRCMARAWDSPVSRCASPTTAIPPRPATAIWRRSSVDSRAKVDALYAKAMELGGKAKARPGFAATKARGPSTALTSATSTAISSPPSASARREPPGARNRPAQSRRRSRRRGQRNRRQGRRGAGRAESKPTSNSIDGGDCAVRSKAIANVAISC